MKNKTVYLLKQYMREIYFHENKTISIFILLISVLRIGIVLIPPLYIMKIMDSAIPENNLKKLCFYIFVVMFSTVIDGASNLLLEKLYSILSKKVTVFYQKKVCGICLIFMEAI